MSLSQEIVDSIIAKNNVNANEKIYDAFTDALTARMSALVLGDGLDAKTTVGPLVSKSQQQQVAKLGGRSKSFGAKVACGGTAATDGSYGYFPTVLTDVSFDAPILRTEILGSCTFSQIQRQRRYFVSRQQCRTWSCFLCIHPRFGSGHASRRVARVWNGWFEPRTSF